MEDKKNQCLSEVDILSLLLEVKYDFDKTVT